MRKPKAVYVTTQPFPVILDPVLEAFVLVKVKVDILGRAICCEITPGDVKTKVASAQSRAALQLRKLVRQDEWAYRNSNTRAVPSFYNGLTYLSPNGRRPYFLDLVTGYSVHEPGPDTHPLDKIYWWIYKLDAKGMTFVRVACQYP